MPSMQAVVAVATDSSASLPPQIAQHWDVDVVPLQVILGGQGHREGDGITSLKVLESLVAGAKVTTSQPTTADLQGAIDRAAMWGAQALVFVTLSGKTSGTADAMRALAERARIPVHVVDSGTLSLAVGLSALSAAHIAALGGSAEEVLAEARRCIDSSVCLFTVDTLEYMRRGGRVSGAVAMLSKGLGIKPVLGLKDGEVVPLDRVRTTARARARVVDSVVEHAGQHPGAVIGLLSMPGDDDVVDQIKADLSERGAWPVMVARLSAALAVHGGPGTLAAVAVDVHPEVLAELQR